VSVGERFGAVAAWCARHARAVLVVSALVAIAAAVTATRLPTDAGTDTLVDSDSASFQATERVRERFGDDPVVVLAKGDLRRLVLTSNLGRLLRLEGCLAGNPPADVDPLPGPCAEIAELHPAKFVSGPATFLNQAVIGIEEQLGGSYRVARAQAIAAGRAAARDAAAQGLPRAEQERAGRAAAQAVLRGFQAQLLRIAAEYGITSLPSLDNLRFVEAVVFDLRQTGGTPKAKLSYLFPNSDSAQIIIRLRPNLTDSERHRALELIREAVDETTPRKVCAENGKPAPCFQLRNGSYLVSGAPVVVDGLAGTLADSLLVLFAVAVALMALTLPIVFRSRLRLLPLALALAAAGLTFGLLGAAGGSLTMASIAVLPVLIGLAVDYAIQFQARFDEARSEGLDGAAAARAAAARGAPVIGTACIATAAGFLALQLSPTPMVRSFGLLLTAGVAIAFGLALTAGFAALALRPSGAPGSETRRRRVPARLRAAIAAGARARDRLGGAIGAGVRRALAVAITNPARVLAVAFALAACGWVAGTGTETVSDIRQLVPQDLREVRDLNELQDSTGVSGELDVSVDTPDLTDPELIAWIADFKQRVLESNGFRGEFPSCADADICPGPALSDFISNPSRGVTRERVRALIDALPDYDLRQVITVGEDGEPGHTTNVAFGIRAQSLDDQQALIERVRDEIDPPGPGNGPPEGTTVALAGLPVLAAESATDLSQSRYWLTLAGLAAVALALLAVYRSLARALLPLVPIVLATGWSSLVLEAMGIPLNPMSAALGALVIAIGTEFSVILSSRYHEERGGGRSVGEALRRAYDRTGAAVLASGATAIVGFAALIASDVRMLRDFGFVTVVDLAVALLGVMLVLPAALVWGEEGMKLSFTRPRRTRERARFRRWRRTSPAA
jgi:hydrophobe/amphiphile efflux-3 (HAE3) family protein